MNFIIGQLISIAALILSVIIAQFKEVKHILVGEILSNLSIALSFFFLGGMSGAWICIVAAIQTMILYKMNQKQDSERLRRSILILFACIYVLGTIMVFKGWEDIVSCICAFCFLLAVGSREGKQYRRYMMLNSLLWIVYDIVTLAYVNAVTHGLILVSLGIAMVRLDRKNKAQR